MWILFQTLLFIPSPTGRPYLALVCHRARGEIRVDGKLGEPVWREAAWATNFVLLGTDKLASAQTLFSVVYDEKRLYIGVECLEPHTEAMVVEHRERDSEVWMDDAVEVFIDPKHSHDDYYQFIVNAGGVRFDAHRTDWGWDGKWEAAARIERGLWTAEFCLPFSTLGMGAPKAGEVIGFNLCRDRQPAGRGKVFEWSSWSPVERGFHEPQNFGHLLFVPDGVEVPPLEWVWAIGGEGAYVKVFCRRGVLEFAPYPALARHELSTLASEVERQLEEIRREMRRAKLPSEEREEFERVLSELWRLLVLHRSPERWLTLRGWAEAREGMRRLREEACKLMWRLKFARLFSE